MSRGARLGLVALAAIVAIAAFIALRPSDDDDSPENAAQTQTQTTPAERPAAGTPTATAESAPAPPPDHDGTLIDIRGGKPAGGPVRIEVETGDVARFTVTTDSPTGDEIHLHGYDVTKDVVAGKPTKFEVKADAEGIFEIESHTAEDAGLDPLVGELVVGPS